jgi:DNA-3-methyladenine glycosylase I
MRRCGWPGDDPLYLAYHDEEWGVPVHDDRHLFEMLVLESMQSGLSWLTILRKRAGFREAFDGFNYELVARYGDKKIAALLLDARIVRNRAKIDAAIQNAKAAVQVRDKLGSLDQFLWEVIDGRPIVNRLRSYREAPAQTAESTKLAKRLRENGFKFIGPTVAYAFMQAVGMVNDHEVSCFRWRQVAGRKT